VATLGPCSKVGSLKETAFVFRIIVALSSHPFSSLGHSLEELIEPLCDFLPIDAGPKPTNLDQVFLQNIE
jgi:hypothetical protein